MVKVHFHKVRFVAAESTMQKYAVSEQQNFGGNRLAFGFPEHETLVVHRKVPLFSDLSAALLFAFPHNY